MTTATEQTVTEESTVLLVDTLWVSGVGGPILRGVSFEVGRGEALALVGESGSGKSMTARAVMRLLAPGLAEEGDVVFKGQRLSELSERQMRKIRGQQIGLIFQDPFTQLNPTMRCGDQILASVRDRDGRPLRGGVREHEIRRRLSEVGIRDMAVAQAYPAELSGGLRQRVGIAAALAQDPDLIIADEPTTALDVTTQRDVLRLLRRMQRERGAALILITHDLRVAFSMCDRVAVMYAGEIVESGSAGDLAHRPRHPYTHGLLNSEPPADLRLPRLAALPGQAARASDPASGCVFAPRCEYAQDACSVMQPTLVSVQGREVACLRAAELDLMPAAHTEIYEPSPIPEPTGSPVITCVGLRKAYGSQRRRTVAMEDVSVSLYPGECVGIVGESGSGKSTLARAIIGLEQVDDGRILVDGIDATDMRRLSTGDTTRVRRTVQMVFQDPNSTLNPALSIRNTLAEALRASGEASGAGEVGRLLELVGLAPGLADSRPRALSGGQRQRVAIARALAMRPRVLICDEAVSALDVSVQAQILNLLADLRLTLGLGILFITHDLAVVRQVADRVYVMSGGRIVESGPTAEVLDEPRDKYTRRLMSAAPRVDTAWLETA